MFRFIESLVFKFLESLAVDRLTIGDCRPGTHMGPQEAYFSKSCATRPTEAQYHQ